VLFDVADKPFRLWRIVVAQLLSPAKTDRLIIELCGNAERRHRNFALGLFTEKAFPEDEALATTAIDTRGPTAVESQFVFEKRFGATG